MNVNEFAKISNFKCLNPECLSDNEISGVFIGDLLSWVMGNGQKGQMLITVQGHLNVVAVAVLNEFSGIILAHGASVNEDSLKRAIEEKMPIFISDLPVYECAKICSQNNL